MKTDAVTIREVGQIKEIKKSIIKVEGLSNCMVGQLVIFSDNSKGFVMGFKENETLVLALVGHK